MNHLPSLVSLLFRIFHVTSWMKKPATHICIYSHACRRLCSSSQDFRSKANLGYAFVSWFALNRLDSDDDGDVYEDVVMRYTVSRFGAVQFL